MRWITRGRQRPSAQAAVGSGDARRGGGWISAQLVHPLIALVLVGLALLGLGRLRPRDVGWRASAVMPAALLTLGVWASVQASVWIGDIVSASAPEWTWAWRGVDGHVLAAFHSQIAGNALVEETLFRGCLLPQLWLAFRRRLRAGAALLVTLVITTALSVLVHVPAYAWERALRGSELADALWWLAGFQLTMAAAFLVTRNLFLCVGLHALWNALPMLAAAPEEQHERAWWVATWLLLVGWCVAQAASRRELVATSTARTNGVER